MTGSSAKRLAWFAGAATVAGVVVVATGGAAERPGQLLPYEDGNAIAAGQVIYADHCAACHGAALEGQVPNWRERGPDGLLPAPPHDETGHTWHHPDSLLVDITTRGTEAVVGGGYQSAMPGFQDVLTEQQILSVLAYIKSTWPDEVVEIHNKINADFASYGG